MSTGTTVIIVIAIIVVVAIVAGVVYDTRRRRLRQRFGPEYDRLIDQGASRRQAEAELAARERRVKDLAIRPLGAEAQARYSRDWAAVQEEFVDAPQDAVAAAQRLVMTVMNERGYPTEGTDQVLADLSVEHARVRDHDRAAYAISQRAADGMASTEDLRQAMIHYRALFQDLLGAPTRRGREAEAPAEPYAAGPADTPDPVATSEPAATADPANGSARVVVAEPAEDGEPGAEPAEPAVPQQRQS
jgi:Tfp pilus assembly protein PilX